ncbi:hypothetical protein MGN70_008776 [Eutypa lata]|uniref:Uncharacterized protein n=1 Tax=Eutypa lata (strain UCR-EL1) TaxID=1287681 RepID=M7TD54_EUTLA|nr:hypothetical protein UCREL1_5190 [Eutypa lata UCREL1]KAI1249166.1 hypothetical protein MGN70_008776 [Eutypa lata]
MAAPRKRPRLGMPYTGDFWKGDNLEWTRAHVLDNGLIRPKATSRAKLDKALPDPNDAADHLYGLNTLQQREDSPANDPILLGSLQAMTSYLPTEVFDQIYIGEQPGESTDFSVLVQDAAFARQLATNWPLDHAMYRNIKFGPFFFWPINTGKEGSSSSKDHYVTVIMWLRQNPDAVAEREKHLAERRRASSAELQAPVPYDEVLQWSIVDPKRGNFDAAGNQTDGREANRHIGRVQCVRRRVRAILERGGLKWDFATEFMQSTGAPTFALPWVPPQRDDWSSGMRSFALIKKQCDVVLEAHCAEVPVDDAYFWERASGWLNPHQVRHEMMGLLALKCIAKMSWKARIAIEPIVDLDGVMQKDKFPAKKLKPSETPSAWYPQGDFDGPDLTRVSNGYKDT